MSDSAYSVIAWHRLGYPHRRDAAVQAINRHFLDEERGRWHQMLDLAAFGVVYPDELALRMQEALQVMSGPDSGAVREFEVTPGRLMPGIGFQASLAWRHLDANEAATQHLNWCETRSSLWQLQPDRNKAVGGWIDWVDEVGGQAPCWQRFIDTSFILSILVGHWLTGSLALAVACSGLLGHAICFALCCHVYWDAAMRGIMDSARCVYL
ncbi:unnamed protein product [Polarella glacialis]|uniref:Uncharacterized protein n=1 Tax=Polarella glacialis TaxID=89957 RepID=A0A813JGV7_POLGL|nr:unnamed protein product [Polarella glacialis]